MNILILCTAAPGHLPFFFQLATALTQDHHEVYFAFDSRLANSDYPDCKVTDKVFYYSDHRRDADASVLNEFAHCNFWKLFFSDYDRFQTYGINLHRDATWYQCHAARLLSFFKSIFVSADIDVVIHEGVTSSFSYFCYLVCAAQGKRYVGISSSRLPGRFEIHDSPEGLGLSIQETYERYREGANVVTEETKEAVSAYIPTFMAVAPDYVKHNGLLLANPVRKYLTSEKIAFLLRRARFVLTQPTSEYPYQMGNPLTLSYRLGVRSIARYFKSFLITKYYDKPSVADDYYLYPLHFHPESSTSIHARHYVDEYVTIKNIAFNLPQRTVLYVKDHLSAAGFPSVAFYKQLTQLPNVKIIAPDENTKQLILRARGVITLTSTVGFEAVVLGKPVYVLGDVFYDFHPLCRKMNSWNDLFPLLTTDAPSSGSDSESFDFLAAYWQCTLPGTLRIGRIVAPNPILTIIVGAVESALTRG